jgi:Uma2 family endonuclease
MSITIDLPPGPWTLADLGRVPATGHRVEIHEGNLVIMSPVTFWHSDVSRRICNALIASGRTAAQEVGVKGSERDTRIADIAVFRVRPLSDQAFWTPDQLEAVIEVVSDSSEDDDRVAKPRWYAAAGIPEYWRVERADETNDAVIVYYDLRATATGSPAYVEHGTSRLSTLEKPQT